VISAADIPAETRARIAEDYRRDDRVRRVMSGRWLRAPGAKGRPGCGGRPGETAAAPPGHEDSARPAAFFARHIVLHTHVEKSAGSTLCYALTRMFGPEHCLDTRPREAPRPEALSPDALARLRLLSGHFHAGSHEQLFDRVPVRIATVREPVARLLSFLGFLARSPDHPEYPRLGTLPPDAAVEVMLAEGHRMVSNSQCRVLSGTTVFEAAHRAAEEEYLAVLPHARALDLARLFSDALRLPAPNPNIRRNAAPDGGRPVLSPRLEELVRHAVAEDARLVAWAEDTAEATLARARARLEAMATPA
jgi:hypothetical protein